VATLRQKHLQIVTGDELHDDELSAIFLKVVCNFRERGMPQVREQPSLTLESLAHSLFGKEGLFQSNSVAQTLVARQINRSHAAVPNRAHDQITILQNCIRREHVKNPLQCKMQNAKLKVSGEATAAILHF
jgi:hypothetical protein